MPQIPLFNQAQRLEPGSPVQAVSPENSAGNLQGNMVEAFGSALTKVGDLLDNTAKVNKNAEQDLEAELLSGEAERKLVLLGKQMEAAPVDLKDAPDGTTSAKQFEDGAKEILTPLLERASDDRVRGLIQKKINSTIVRGMTVGAADAVKKRAENLPIIRQEIQNNMQIAARGDYSQVPSKLAEWEIIIRNDKTIPESDKLKIIAEGGKSIATEGLRGLYDGALQEAGKPSAMQVGQKFDVALRKLNEDMSLIYTPDEKEKLRKEITTERNQFWAENQRITMQREHAQEYNIKENDRKANLKYTQQLVVAGTDNAKADVIKSQIMNDPSLTPETKKTLLTSSGVFVEVKNDKFESEFNEKLYLGKFTTETALKEVDRAFEKKEISMDRKLQLMQKVHTVTDQDQSNPGLTAVTKSAEREIKSKFGLSIFDADDILFKDGKNEKAAQALSSFADKVADLRANKNYNQATVRKAQDEVYKQFGLANIDYKNGVGSLGTYRSSDQAQKAIDALLLDRQKNGGSWDEKTTKQRIKQLQTLQNNKKALQDVEAIRVNVAPSGGGKVMGDE